MDHPACVSDFVRKVNLAIKRKRTQLNIICKCEKNTIFPDACVPISALIQYYKDNCNIEFNVNVSDNSYLSNCGFAKPFDLSDNNTENYNHPLDKVLVYSANTSQVGDLVQAYINCMQRQSICEDGVLAGLTWCINEVMDNVFVHSEESHGYIMAQYHRKKQKLAICVYDYGIGIYKSLLNGEHKPETEGEALKTALKDGVGDGQGQGNGLYGLYQIINENGGKLTISSGKSALMFKDGNFEIFNDIALIDDNHRGTSVDFQLNLSKKIDIKDALKAIGGQECIDLRIDDMIDDNNSVLYDVAVNTTDTGTRTAGRELRNDVINIMKRSKCPVILDFSNIEICSSSFIDEFLCKLMFEIGMLEFTNSVKIRGMNDVIGHLFQRSSVMRMHKEWENATASTEDLEQ